MGLYGYDWQPHEITTEDGYTVTLMNVTSKERSRKTNADGMPLLVMPMAGIAPD